MPLRADTGQAALFFHYQCRLSSEWWTEIFGLIYRSIIKQEGSFVATFGVATPFWTGPSVASCTAWYALDQVLIQLLINTGYQPSVVFGQLSFSKNPFSNLPVTNTTCLFCTASTSSCLWLQIGSSLLAARYSVETTGPGGWGTPPPNLPKVGLLSLASTPAMTSTLSLEVTGHRVKRPFKTLLDSSLRSSVASLATMVLFSFLKTVMYLEEKILMTYNWWGGWLFDVAFFRGYNTPVFPRP